MQNDTATDPKVSGVKAVDAVRHDQRNCAHRRDHGELHSHLRHNRRPDWRSPEHRAERRGRQHALCVHRGQPQHPRSSYQDQAEAGGAQEEVRVAVQHLAAVPPVELLDRRGTGRADHRQAGAEADDPRHDLAPPGRIGTGLRRGEAHKLGHANVRHDHDGDIQQHEGHNGRLAEAQRGEGHEAANKGRHATNREAHCAAMLSHEVRVGGGEQHVHAKPDSQREVVQRREVRMDRVFEQLLGAQGDDHQSATPKGKVNSEDAA
mmetsp:Transcript_41363/g.133371  ORF Transcript_41363/g.133371 Transcript_41363/m.133371 type:complete len:263 (+) Transcript_41363:469-1257(+)